MTAKWLGIGTPTSVDPGINALDVSGNLYILGNQGINMVPIRTLDVNGDFRASDGNGTLDFNLGNITVSNATGTLTFASGVTTSTGGFASVQGTTPVSGGVTTIGTLKKGIVFVSAVDSATSANRASRMLFAYTTSNAEDNGSNIAVGNTSITLSTSNIQITDATNATYDWSITYFPLP